MTQLRDPFDHQPDPAIARLLHDHLDPGDHAAFAERIRNQLREVPDSSWDILARWSRPGVAVAAGVGMLLGLWLTDEPAADPAMTLEDAIRPAAAPAQLFASGRPPTGDVVLSAVMNAR